jgi:lipoprotein-anchoring transpeptidase ErfK/SrfK
MDQDILATATDLREFTDVKTTSWCYADIMEATIDHDGQVDEEGVEQWLSYTPAYTVTYYYSGTSFQEKVYAGDYAVLTPKTNADGKTITRWIFPTTGVMKDPTNTAIYGPTSYTAWYAPTLISDHSQYISGYTDGTFKPNGTLTRAEAVQILYNLLADQSVGSYPSSFTDVASGSWYYTAVTTLASRGLLVSGGKFRPNDAITRGEFVEMVAKLVPYQNAKLSFTDVESNSTYYSAIATAVSKGWVSGYPDGTFRPSGNLTRAEAVTVFNKILGRVGDATTEKQMDSRYTFTDVASTSWAYQAIMEAATTHTFTWKNNAESWSTYTHNYTKSVNWESSDSVVAAASITNTITSTYSGNYTHSYNWDYSEGLAESYVSSYSSSSNYLIWVSLQNQKVYVFYGSKGNWDLIHTFICGTGKSTSPTPTGVTKTTYKQTGWFESSYTVAPVVRFYPNTGYAFHSRLYYPGGSSVLKDASIGYPVSHGCVRMLTPDVTYIYNWIPNGTTVIIY